MNKLKKYGLLSLSLLALGLVGCNSNGNKPSVLPSLTPSETKPSEELPTEKPSQDAPSQVNRFLLQKNIRSRSPMSKELVSLLTMKIKNMKKARE